MRLTVKRIARANKPGRYSDGNNLYMQTGPSGTKAWLLRYVRDGRERWMGLGSINDFTLEEARERAREQRQLLAKGVDPLDARKAERAAKALEAARALTFKDAAEQYYILHESTWSNAKHRQQFRATLDRYVFPKIGMLAVADIDVGQVLRCIEPDWSTKPTTMARVRARIERVLTWATVRGYRQGDNPAAWRGHLAEALPAPSKVAKVEHHSALPYGEVPKFMAELRAVEGVAARALEFLILTAARTGEVTGARWDEIDLDEATWIIPAERMKAAREHRVPLCARAVALLTALPREAAWVFLSPALAGASISDQAMRRVLRRLRADAVVHGFRSSFSDWCHEQTAFDNHTIELALAHSVGTEVERAYRRGPMLEKRKMLMEAWSSYCTSPPAEGEVIPLRKRDG